MKRVRSIPLPRPGRPAAAGLCLAVLLLTAAGCGYQLVGRGNALPEHVHTIAVPIFRNQTFEYGIETIFTYALIDELEKRSGIEIVDAETEADAVFEVLLKDYRYFPLTDGAGQVIEYRITLLAEIALTDRVQKQILWEDTGYVFTQSYAVSSSNLASYEDNRREAWEEAGQDFAESVVGAALEGF